MSPILVRPFQATINDVFVCLFCNRLEGFKSYPPNTGPVPKVIPLALYLEMVPSSPSDYVYYARCVDDFVQDI